MSVLDEENIKREHQSQLRRSNRQHPNHGASKQRRSMHFAQPRTDGTGSSDSQAQAQPVRQVRRARPLVASLSDGA